MKRAISLPARLLGFGGAWAVFVNAYAPTREHAYYAAHEIGQLWLHVDDADGRHACVYNLDDTTSPDAARVRVMCRRIDGVDNPATLTSLRGEIRIAFDRNPRIRQSRNGLPPREQNRFRSLQRAA